ncbi:hypothetical protein GCM10010492_45860 [Saccharothrix mutabilis subsp. mutabilis]|uniref:Uncharacterized protein n=1 Tax=Saccharothrix mutabilis subsp. mutabilis TaxID=66855 RepID=A0ABP3DVZ4_9PSEU
MTYRIEASHAEPPNWAPGPPSWMSPGDVPYSNPQVEEASGWVCGKQPKVAPNGGPARGAPAPVTRRVP